MRAQSSAVSLVCSSDRLPRGKQLSLCKLLGNLGGTEGLVHDRRCRPVVATAVVLTCGTPEVTAFGYAGKEKSRLIMGRDFSWYPRQDLNL